jgi:predicted DNA-binding transcriptional regulator AlpA
MVVIKIPPERVLLTRADLRHLGILKSNVSLLRAERDARFPARARLTGTTVVWFKDEIVAYLQAIADKRATHVYSDLR